MSNITQTHAHPLTRTPALAVFWATALGIVILVAAGFAPVPAVHNAAHDTRHGFAFPCH
ncbi:MAG: CbtB domain-containing protein [Gammaproteobacteria bacterium]